MKKEFNRNWMKASLSALCLLGLGACATTVSGETAVKEQAQSVNWRDQFSAARFEADVKFLSQDLLRGRDTGSEGHRIAANYVAAQMASLGLKPAGDDDSFFQEVPFRKVKLDKENSFVRVTLPNGKVKELKAGTDFFLTGNAHVPNAQGAGELVFAGYGVHAPEVGYSDLEGLDLKGKIAVVFGDGPKGLNSEIRAHFNSSANKAKALFDRGAIGIILLNRPSRQKGWNADTYNRIMDRGAMSWVPQKGTDTRASGRLSAAIHYDVAKELFEGAEKDFDQVLKDFEKGELTSFALKSKAEIKRSSVVVENFTSPNVLGVIEGSDPKLKNEYVVLSGHLDHIGVSPAEKTKDGKEKDVINNGAMDNATGIATMLEVARNIMRNGERPRRSILLAAVTAEEKGLLGAEYFAHYPTIKKSKLVGNVNLDMPILLYDFADVVAFGADRSSLGVLAKEAVTKAGIKLSDDPLPSEGLFVRSDHYRFVQQGIPAVFLMTGFGKTADGEIGQEKFMEFLGNHYHTPNDQISLPIRYDAGAKFAYVNYLILSSIANADKRPMWNEGDFFGNLYGK